MSTGDFVFRDGEFIREFEQLYKNVADPWNQQLTTPQNDSRRALAVDWCKRLNQNYSSSRILELGCGFGHITGTLSKLGFEAHGIDISVTAIAKARELYPQGNFHKLSFREFEEIFALEPDIIIMAEITWYILEELPDFLLRLLAYSNKRVSPVHLIHLLTTYDPDVQKYGLASFQNLSEILTYFKLNYLEYGTIRNQEINIKSQGTYFVGQVPHA